MGTEKPVLVQAADGQRRLTPGARHTPGQARCLDIWRKNKIFQRTRSMTGEREGLSTGKIRLRSMLRALLFSWLYVSVPP